MSFLLSFYCIVCARARSLFDAVDHEGLLTWFSNWLGIRWCSSTAVLRTYEKVSLGIHRLEKYEGIEHEVFLQFRDAMSVQTNVRQSTLSVSFHPLQF